MQTIEGVEPFGEVCGCCFTFGGGRVGVGPPHQAGGKFFKLFVLKTHAEFAINGVCNTKVAVIW